MSIEGIKVNFPSEKSLDNACDVFREINFDEARCIQRFNMGQNIERLPFTWKASAGAVANRLVITNNETVRLDHEAHSEDFHVLFYAIQNKLQKARGWAK